MSASIASVDEGRSVPKQPPTLTKPYQIKQFILKQKAKEARSNLIVSSAEIKARGIRLDRKGDITANDTKLAPLLRFSSR